jgi:O-acetyl-ADP-ribose deacetylase (regulator of RNase III)
MKQRCDAIVSPANSFGFMEGGIDLPWTRGGRDLAATFESSLRTKKKSPARVAGLISAKPK